jgi:hypothetical protein
MLTTKTRVLILFLVICLVVIGGAYAFTRHLAKSHEKMCKAVWGVSVRA